MEASSAQQAYAFLVEHHLSPGFRLGGFRGSSGHYQLPSTSHWALVELHKSAFSDRGSVRITANLFVVPRSSWSHETRAASIASLRPHARTADDYLYQARLGMLASSDEADRWWDVAPSTDLAAHARSFFADLDRAGIP